MYYVIIPHSKEQYGPFGTVKECNWWAEREIEAQQELFPEETNQFVNYIVRKKR